MKVTNNQLLIAKDIIAQELLNLPLRANISLKILSIRDVISDKVKVLLEADNNLHNNYKDIFDASGKLRPEFNNTPRASDFISEKIELMNTEVELAIAPLKKAYFIKTPGPTPDDSIWHDVKPAVFIDLEWLFDPEEVI